MQLNDLQLILKLLQELNKECRNSDTTLYHGICGSVGRQLEDSAVFVWGSTLDECFSDWPRFSGDVDYPVPSGSAASAITAYLYHSSEGSLWTGRYGRSRRGLLLHCIKWYKAKIKEVQRQAKLAQEELTKAHAQKIQSIFATVIAGGWYAEQYVPDTSSSYMCNALDYAALAGAITQEDADLARLDIKEYLAELGATPIETMRAFYSSHDERVHLYSNWAERVLVPRVR